MTAVFKIGDLSATVDVNGKCYDILFRFDHQIIAAAKRVSVKANASSERIAELLVDQFGVLEGPAEEWAAFCHNTTTRKLCRIVAEYIKD